MRKSWEDCRGASNSQDTRDNVKDLDVYSINKEKILKGSKDNDEMRSVISKTYSGYIVKQELRGSLKEWRESS